MFFCMDLNFLQLKVAMAINGSIALQRVQLYLVLTYVILQFKFLNICIHFDVILHFQIRLMPETLEFKHKICIHTVYSVQKPTPLPA